MNDKQIEELITLRKQLFIYFIEVSNQRGYATPESCVSYLNSSVVAWVAEAKAFNAWRDATYLILNDIENTAQQAGIVPTFDEVVAKLPAIVWPT